MLETVERDLNVISELGLNLKLAFNTHAHADHVTGSGLMKKKIEGLQSVISEASKAKADIKIVDNQVIKVDDLLILTALATPGHTNGCITYLFKAEGFLVFLPGVNVYFAQPKFFIQIYLYYISFG